MLRPFKLFQYGSDVVVVAAWWEAQRTRLDLEPASWSRLAHLCQSKAQQVVHDDLEGLATAAHFLFEEHSDVFVDGESCPHIMMVNFEAS